MLPRGPILCVTSPALDSNDSSDKYSNFAVAGAGHVTVFIYIYIQTLKGPSGQDGGEVVKK